MKTLRSTNFAIFLLANSGCKKTEITPTGSLKINFNSSATNRYYLMTEAAASSSGSGLFLRTGDVTGLKSFVIDNLNTGDYILSLNNNSRAVQVTAGQQREYTFYVPYK